MPMPKQQRRRALELLEASDHAVLRIQERAAGRTGQRWWLCLLFSHFFAHSSLRSQVGQSAENTLEHNNWLSHFRLTH
jgi:hypothetical protein